MNDLWAPVFADFTVYLFVLVRMGGMLAFNPFLSRRNIPGAFKAGLVLGLTLVVAPSVVAGLAVNPVYTGVEIYVGVLRELFLGISCGFVFTLFYYFIFFAGDLADQQMGMSMAKVFDPATQIQMSVTGNLFSVVIMLYFFMTDTHLLTIKLFAYSFEIITPGAANLTLSAVTAVYIDLFLNVMLLTLNLAVPIMAVIFITDISMGILMKLIPQIHVFVINMQVKVITGMLMLMVLAVPISEFMIRYINLMFESVQRVMLSLIA